MDTLKVKEHGIIFGNLSTEMQLQVEQLKFDLLQCCKVLVNYKLDSCPFGNVSLRIPGTEVYLQNPVGIYFKNLTLDDILYVDTSGKVLIGKHKSHPGEFIHREIYRLRSDVHAIVHTHSYATSFFSLLGVPIEPFTQLGASFFNDQAVYTGFTGPVRSAEEGRIMAETLGNKSLLIAKNHGIFAVANNIQRALWDFIIADQAACIHLEAIKLGLKKADILTDEYLQKSRNEVRNLQCEAFWVQNSFLQPTESRSTAG